VQFSGEIEQKIREKTNGDLDRRMERSKKSLCRIKGNLREKRSFEIANVGKGDVGRRQGLCCSLLLISSSKGTKIAETALSTIPHFLIVEQLQH
jgi:hypothetical protein